MSKRGGKRLKGIPVDWDEPKKRRNINLTDTAWNRAAEIGRIKGISRSEVIERLIRQSLTLEEGFDLLSGDIKKLAGNGELREQLDRLVEEIKDFRGQQEI